MFAILQKNHSFINIRAVELAKTLPYFQIIWFQFSSDCNCYISAVGNVPSDSSLQLPAPRQAGLQVSQKIKHYLDDEDGDEDDGDLYFFSSEF